MTTQRVLNIKGKHLHFKEDKLHRIDGPAVVHPDGRKEFWLNNKKLPDYFGAIHKDYLEAALKQWLEDTSVRYEIVTIEVDGPGDVVASSRSLKRARDKAFEVGNGYPLGVAVYDTIENLYDCGDQEWTTKEECWHAVF